MISMVEAFALWRVFQKTKDIYTNKEAIMQSILLEADIGDRCFINIYQNDLPDSHPEAILSAYQYFRSLGYSINFDKENNQIIIDWSNPEKPTRELLVDGDYTAQMVKKWTIASGMRDFLDNLNDLIKSSARSGNYWCNVDIGHLSDDEKSILFEHLQDYIINVETKSSCTKLLIMWKLP